MKQIQVIPENNFANKFKDTKSENIQKRLNKYSI